MIAVFVILMSLYFVISYGMLADVIIFNSWFHRQLFPIAKVFVKKSKTQYMVKFDDSCKYTFQDADQHDINKLFGVTTISLKGIWWSIKNFKPIHHYNSFRWGWSYSPSNDMFQIYQYIYKKGIRKIIPYGFAFTNENFILTLKHKAFDVYLNGYFGGQKKPTHLIRVKRQKLWH